MKILFVRHGETFDNLRGFDSPCQSDAKLTDDGKEQALALAQEVKKYDPEIIYCSPTQRTQETAQIIKASNDVPLEIEKRLIERNWGDWGDDGLSWREIVETKLKHLDINQRRSLLPPNGETWIEMEERLMEFIHEIKLKHEENVVIVTHTGCLRALLPVLIQESIENHEKYSVKTGSITVFCTEEEKFDIFNQH